MRRPREVGAVQQRGGNVFATRCGSRCARAAQRAVPVSRRGAGAGRDARTVRVGEERAAAMWRAPRTSQMRDGKVRAGASRRSVRPAPVDAPRDDVEEGMTWRWARGVVRVALCRRHVCRWCRDGAMRRVSATRYAMHRTPSGRRTTRKSLRTFAHLHLRDAGTARGREIFFQLADRLARTPDVPVDASPMPVRSARAVPRRCRKRGNFPAFFACVVFPATPAAAIGAAGTAVGAACRGRAARTSRKKIARKC